MAEWTHIAELAHKRWLHIPNCAAEEEAAALLQRSTAEVRDALGLPREAMIYLCLASVQTIRSIPHVWDPRTAAGRGSHTW